MSTFLSKLFKPKWQNKQAHIRLESLADLDPNSLEDQKILLQLADQDDSPKVRAAAVEKINDTEALISLHGKAENETRSVIEARLYALANQRSLSIFDLVIDIELLTEMIIAANDPDAFINGLARIESAPALLKIATQGRTSKIRQAAAELLESETELKELVSTAKSKDKGVYQIAKNKLDRLREQSKLQAKIAEKIATLLQAIEEHSKTDNLKLYDSKLDSLLQRWNEVKNQANAGDTAKFEVAKQACEQRTQELKERADKEEQERLLEKAGGDEQQATLLTLEQTYQRFQENPAQAQDATALDAILKTQETRWLEATRHVNVEKAEARRYQQLMGSLRALLMSIGKLREQEEKLQSLIVQINQAQKQNKPADKEGKQLERLLSALEWPSDLARPATLESASKALGISLDISEQLAQSVEELKSEIDDKIVRLDKQLDDKQIKESSKLLKQIQSLAKRLDKRQQDGVQKSLSLRIKQLGELRDWQGYASTPRQLELCELMERLGEQSLSPQDKAEKIKAMQNEWKSLGGASDESLWTRFKEASDAAYEPCKAYFAEQSALKQNNLEKRLTLITQLETFIDNNDWENADWKAADQINRKARQEWRDAYPVDHKDNRKPQKQFNALLEKLDAHLAGEKTRNLELKTKIVEEAEAISPETELGQAMSRAKDLQKQWQSIGITEHKKDRALWKRFRKACDTIFARRDEARSAKEAQLKASAEEASELIKKYQTLLPEVQKQGSEALKSTIDALRKDNKSLPAMEGKTLERHQKAFEALVKDYKQAIRGLKNQERIQQWQEAARKSTLIRAAYLNEADKAALESEWESSVKMSDELERAMKEFSISVKAGAVKSSHVIDAIEARNFCIRCEIAAGLESPESDQELRMQLQVTRLSEGISSSENLSREDQLSELLKEWYLCVGLDESSQAACDARIEKAVKTLFESAPA